MAKLTPLAKGLIDVTIITENVSQSEELMAALGGRYSADGLRDFFFVNTDVGENSNVAFQEADAIKS